MIYLSLDHAKAKQASSSRRDLQSTERPRDYSSALMHACAASEVFLLGMPVPALLQAVSKAHPYQKITMG